MEKDMEQLEKLKTDFPWCVVLEANGLVVGIFYSLTDAKNFRETLGDDYIVEKWKGGVEQ